MGDADKRGAESLKAKKYRRGSQKTIKNSFFYRCGVFGKKIVNRAGSHNAI